MSDGQRPARATRAPRLALAAVLAVVATVGAAGPDATPPATLDVGFLAGDAASCREALGQFRWVCAEFDAPSWQRVFGRPFWARGSLSGIWADFDADGSQDLMLRLGHVGYCGTAGCANLFLFGDQPPGRGVQLWTITSLEPFVVIDEADGVRRLRFGSDGFAFPIEQIRRATLASRRAALGA